MQTPSGRWQDSTANLTETSPNLTAWTGLECMTVSLCDCPANRTGFCPHMSPCPADGTAAGWFSSVFIFFCDGCVRPLGVPESTLFLNSMFIYSFIKHVLTLFLLSHAMVSLREIKVHNKKSLALNEVTEDGTGWNISK